MDIRNSRTSQSQDWALVRAARWEGPDEGDEQDNDGDGYKAQCSQERKHHLPDYLVGCVPSTRNDYDCT